MDKVVHFEIPADDVARAKAFYGSIFGWELDDMEGMDYTIVRTVPIDERFMPREPGAINGGMMQRSADTPSPVLTIGVDSVDDALEHVDPGDGGVRLLQGHRGQRDRCVGERRLTRDAAETQGPVDRPRGCTIGQAPKNPARTGARACGATSCD